MYSDKNLIRASIIIMILIVFAISMLFSACAPEETGGNLPHYSSGVFIPSSWVDEKHNNICYYYNGAMSCVSLDK